MYFAPDLSAANAVIATDLAEEMVREGYGLTVVTSFPHYAGNIVDSEFKGQLFRREHRNGVRVTRTYVYASPQKQRVFVRVLNYISFNVLSVLAGIFSGQQDIILAPSPPLTIGLSAFFISLVKRIPFVYNVQDIYPDVAIKLGALKNPWLIRLSYWLERFVYARARHITVLSEGFRANLLAKGVPPEKVSVIPNFVDVAFVRPLPRENEFRLAHDLRDRFVVLYAGNIGYSQNLEHVLECAALLREQEDLVFFVVGNGSCKPQLEARARELGLANVRFLPFLPREEVPELYAAADACLITLRHGIARDSVPSKAYTIMAAARPVVAAVDRDSDTWKMVEEADCGLCVEPEDPAALAQAIRRLYEDRVLAERMGTNGREHVTTHYTKEAVARQYHELLTSIVNSRH
ncbi:MAG: glycosyltransferase family 4 protein [Chloroflexota bacterium]